MEGVCPRRKAHGRQRCQLLRIRVTDKRRRTFGRRVRLPFRAARATNSARTRLWRRTRAAGHPASSRAGVGAKNLERQAAAADDQRPRAPVLSAELLESGRLERGVRS